MSNKDIASTIEEFYSFKDRVAGLVIKLNKSYKLQVVKASAPTYCRDDELVESFYEGVDAATNKIKTEYTVLMGHFNAKVGKKQAGDRVEGEYGIDSRNIREDLLVEFA